MILIVHTYQEVQAWLAQANSLEFSLSRRNLHDVYVHHESIHNAVNGANEQLALHNRGISELNDLLKDHDSLDVEEASEKLNLSEVHRQSFENFCMNLGKSNERGHLNMVLSLLLYITFYRLMLSMYTWLYAY